MHKRPEIQSDGTEKIEGPATKGYSLLLDQLLIRHITAGSHLRYEFSFSALMTKQENGVHNADVNPALLGDK